MVLCCEERDTLQNVPIARENSVRSQTLAKSKSETSGPERHLDTKNFRLS